MKTCKEMASIWNVTERTVTTFCKTGKIPGAIKVGKSWQIPDDAKKPVDGRGSSGKYVMRSAEMKSLPIGIIIELKWKKDLSAEALGGLADEALAQIHEMRYDAEMKEDGIHDVLKFGIAFSGKKVSVKTK